MEDDTENIDEPQEMVVPLENVEYMNGQPFPSYVERQFEAYYCTGKCILID
jgi:hypothetical protein